MRLEDAPLITCIMPTADRPKFVESAIECFRLQTWANKELIIYDSGGTPIADPGIPQIKIFRGPARSLGDLRNAAIERSQGSIIAHWDDDDWSHQRRLEEQFELLASNDVEVVGYRTMVFFEMVSDRFHLYNGRADYMLGTSLMYLRSSWAARRFQPMDKGEDNAFIHRRRFVTASGHKPVRMIARQHSRNTCSWDLGSADDTYQSNWKKISSPVDHANLTKLLNSTRIWGG